MSRICVTYIRIFVSHITYIVYVYTDTHMYECTKVSITECGETSGCVCGRGGVQDLPLDLAAAAGSQIRRGATWERVSA